jgi:hypothetical protein
MAVSEFAAILIDGVVPCGAKRELIRRTHEAAGLKTTLILLAAPLARAYYPHIGMAQHDSCWLITRQKPPES